MLEAKSKNRLRSTSLRKAYESIKATDEAFDQVEVGLASDNLNQKLKTLSWTHPTFAGESLFFFL